MTREIMTGTQTAAVRVGVAGALDTIVADVLVVFMTEGGVAAGMAAEVDRATGGLLTRLADSGDLSGKRYECVPLLAPPGLQAGQLLVVGLGKREGVDDVTCFRAAASAARLIAARPRAKVVFLSERSWSDAQA